MLHSSGFRAPKLPYSDRHVLCLLRCAGVIVLCCAVLAELFLLCTYIAVGTQRQHTRTCHEKTKKKERPESKETQEGSPTNKMIHVLVSDSRLRRALRGGRIYREGVLRSRRDLSKKSR